MQKFHRLMMTGVLAAGLTPGSALAQMAPADNAAAVLTGLLEAREMTAFAAPDPDRPGRYIAALHIPKSQLLVLEADYPVPVLLDQRLQRREFQEAYMDLQGASPLKGRIFVHDMLANGLNAVCGPGEPFDIVFEDGTTRTTFDGDWTGQKLTEAQYRARFAAANDSYTRMLKILAAALQPAT